MQTDCDPKLLAVLTDIAARSTAYDLAATWPAEDLAALAAIGAMRWVVGKRFGGDDLDPLALHLTYECIASASLATALVLSQRDAAVGFVENSPNTVLRNGLMPKLVRNELWTTIGISHLTTSQQSGTLGARVGAGGSLTLDGTIPWSTGAAAADFIVAGAVVDDGRQVVVALPTDREGVTVEPPMKLAMLAAAPTHAVTCRGVRIDADEILSGPAEKALSLRTKGLPIGQTFAALGLTRAALGLIGHIDSPSATSTLATMQQQLTELSTTVHAYNAKPDSHDLLTGPLLRSECNALAVRTTHAAVALYKGSGLRIDHPAQRLAREVMFLLVWSTPLSVMDRTLEMLSDSL
ncbi:MAG TPA: acyl-CoA dehydrogenase family protein [Tepidisphaeraceae bacterium]|jgi:alkylation response protein AidB-like acyl-CoA dehydrogenase